MYRNNTKKSKRRILLISALLLIVAGGLFLAWFAFLKKDDLPVATDVKQPVNMQPATKEETRYSDDAKDRIVDSESDQPNSERKNVTPIITHTEVTDTAVIVEAFVPGVVETDGSCSLKATQGSLVVTATTGVTPNASTTNCKPFSVARSQFKSQGTWNVAVSYRSNTTNGTSTNSTVEL